MATPVAEIHSMLSQMDTDTPVSPISSTDLIPTKAEDIILAIELVAAYISMSYFKLDGFLPDKLVEIFGKDSIIVNGIWLLILFFAIRYWINKEWERRQTKGK